MTDLEILTNCINELARINVPMGLIEQVGIPVYNVRQELIGLANSIIEKSNKTEKEAKPENTQSNISVLPTADEESQDKEVSTETEDNQNGSEVE